MNRIDPRWWQIGSLSSLVLWGSSVLGDAITPARVAAILATALATQLAWTRVFRLPQFEWKSALISGLGLCFLLRSNYLGLILLGAVLAISSKFLLRRRGKHLFNPTNFAMVAMMLATDAVWVSPGQWGSAALLAFFILCAGGVVIQRSRRSDVTLAFLVAWSALLIGRSMWLGDPLSVPLHRLENGALLIFAFFMISDPKTTPDSRIGRIAFAAIVALGAYSIQFHLFRTNGLLWSLAASSLLVPLIDRIFPSTRFEWHRVVPTRHHRPAPVTAKEVPVFRTMISILLIGLVTLPQSASAFCGFYVAKGDATLFNRASQVVLVREGDRTVMTMASDYEGDPREFAMVVPVPTVLERGQIRVIEKGPIEHLDAYTAPRLVEYHDGDPCLIRYRAEESALPMAAQKSSRDQRAASLGVTIEASYTIGEYDILILSSTQSRGLETWLLENGYTIPPGASAVLGSYIRQNLKFFVAKVNLDEQARLGLSWLRPIQVAFESPRFMLPIRLGTVNANGPQDLFVYALTRTGRVETTNYRTVRLPSDVELPVRIRSDFPRFYKAMFAEQVRKERSAVFLEYAWDMAWCDPCAADPLSPDELRRLGVFWITEADGNRGGAADVFVTRLHVRYDREHFPDDLVFQETGDRSNFQARYVLRHPWTGTSDCPGAAEYREALRERQRREALTLAELTGWPVERAGLEPTTRERRWWEWW
ncbi:MAG TPA: DUF2330 domain-containing protein [Thermoanaerobaculia bacterium]|nr:DUF2330 domain-containing protein [Thermoanaerobaculia bacterium]